jgi:hypothetical protein
MDPINYILDVKNPIEEAIKGYTMGRNDIAQRQELQIQQQTANQQQQLFQDQQTALAEQRAAAAKQQEQAAAFQQDLMIARDAIENKTWTPEMANALKLKYAGNFDEQAAVVAEMQKPMQDEIRKYNVNVAIPLMSGDAETAIGFVEERIAAAKASGNAAEVQAQEAFLQAIKTNPYGAGLGLVLTSNASGLFSDDLTNNILDKTQTGQKQTEAMRTLDAQLRGAGIVPKDEGGNGSYEAALAKAGGVPEAPAQFRAATPEEANRYGAKGGQIEIATNRFYPIDVPKGSSLSVGPDGSILFTEGETTPTEKPKTEGQSSAASYLQRLVGAEELFGKFALEGNTTIPLTKLPSIGTSIESNILSGPEQQLIQAQRDWVRAKLRKESGAVISPEEEADERRTYFPQPGDTPDTIEQKRQSRLAAQRQLEIQAGDGEPAKPTAPDATGWANDDILFTEAMQKKIDNNETITQAEINRLNVIATKGK